MQCETGEGLTHQTTWEDIARSYRQIITQIVTAFTNTYGNEAMEKLVSMAEAVDREADVLVKAELDSETRRFEDELQEKHKKAEDTARRRSQGAKDGWDIRRAKGKS